MPTGKLGVLAFLTDGVGRRLWDAGKIDVCIAVSEQYIGPNLNEATFDCISG